MWVAENYQIIGSLFPRLLGVIYLFVFFPFLSQIRGLIGSEGILPVTAFLKFYKGSLGKRRFLWLPTLFWFNASDTALIMVPVLGTLFALLLIFGVYPFILIPLLLLLHLSIITVGQEFLSFGWELFLCEVSYNAFLISLTSDINPIAWISMNVLIFRFHLQSGTCKLQSKDPTWRHLTALKYHYETQPLPNAFAWLMHKLPLKVQKFSTLMVLVLELAVPFGVFGTDIFRLCTFFALFFLQFSIWISGNYSYLNHLTVALITLLISDTYLTWLFGTPVPKPSSSLSLHLFVSLCALGLIVLQLIRLWIHFFWRVAMPNLLFYFQPFHLANRYGIFAIMTTKRYEIVIEGSIDGVTWKEYLFKYKPSELRRRPRRIAPYQPRLDWQVWFLPFHDYEDEIWFHRFLYCLLKGKPHVLKLLRTNPFPEMPPRYIRAQMYLYKYTDWKTWVKTGAWWTRSYLGQFSPTLSFKS